MRRPHGQAVVDPENPERFALCDRCGRQFNRSDLSWQKQWAGPVLIEPAPFQRTITIPMDPPPAFNARHETPMLIDGANDYTVQPAPGKPMFGGTAQFALTTTVVNKPKSILTSAAAGIKYLGTTLGNSLPNQSTFSVSFWYKTEDVTRSPSVFRCETVPGSDLFRVVLNTTLTASMINSSNPGNSVQSVWNDPDYVTLLGDVVVLAGDPVIIPFIAPSVWAHLLFAVDTTQPVAADRVKIYKNGVLHPTFFNVPCDQYSTFPDFMATGTQLVLGSQSSSSRYVGRLAFFQIIDGQQVLPSDVAQDVAGVWSHKPFTQGFGDTGFYYAGARGLQSQEGRYTFAVTGSNISLDNNDVPPYVSV